MSTDHFKGKIECDEHAESKVPLVVLNDGRQMTWQQFGEQLMTYEGFGFHLEIIDE
jgi:hypothetical protein